MKSAEQNFSDREKSKSQDQCRTQAERPGDKEVSLEQTARRNTVGQQKEEGSQYEDRPHADAKLRTLGRPEQGFKRLELPAADSQRKALHNKAEQTQRAGCKQDDGNLPARLRQPEQPGR